MNANAKVTADHLNRRAIVYVRQSSPIQVANNLESQRGSTPRPTRLANSGFNRSRSSTKTLDVLVPAKWIALVLPD
jgi:hypothetical protein